MADLLGRWTKAAVVVRLDAICSGSLAVRASARPYWWVEVIPYVSSERMVAAAPRWLDPMNGWACISCACQSITQYRCRVEMGRTRPVGLQKGQSVEPIATSLAALLQIIPLHTLGTFWFGGLPIIQPHLTLVRYCPIPVATAA